MILVLGSFTGIRIGISSVKAMAEAKKIKIIPVNSLEALAYNAETSEEYICSLIDARNNNAYSGLFDANYNLVKELSADSIDTILENLPNAKTIFVGNATQIHREKITEKFGDNAIFLANNSLSSAKLGICAYNKISKNEVVSPDELLPLYLRKSQAERMLENG